MYETLLSIPVHEKHALKHVFLLEEAKVRDPCAKTGGIRMGSQESI